MGLTDLPSPIQNGKLLLAGGNETPQPGNLTFAIYQRGPRWHGDHTIV